MSTARRLSSLPLPALAAALLVAVLSCGTAAAQRVSLDDLVSGVVHVKTFINPDGKTLESLGRDRDGTGIVIDDNGLILTIGYLMVEAHTAEVVTNDGHAVPADILGYDNDTGFGLLKAVLPLKVRPLAFGKSADVKAGDPVMVAGYGGAARAAPVRVVAKRQFAGYWEYLLDNALFTSPPYREWSGAALIDHDGKLIGVGSLVVGDATGKGDDVAGNMFVPIDLLPPILADLIADGHAAGAPRPWIGLYTQDVGGHLVVARVTAGTPADKAGLRQGDVIVGIGGAAVTSLPDFYRKMWARGTAGVTIPLDIRRDHEQRRVDVRSMNRLDYLKLKSSF
jgi:S1-C subfamily serine protease